MRRPFSDSQDSASTKLENDGLTNEHAQRVIFKAIEEYVRIRRRYYSVAGICVFTAVYLLTLYFQGTQLHAYDVVSSLRQAIVPGETLTAQFHSNDALLEYIRERITDQMWLDPVCGDGVCQMPWERPAYGRFGCQADCGMEKDTTRLMIQIKANFAGQPSINPRKQRKNWPKRTVLVNMIFNMHYSGRLNDKSRFAEDQIFTEITANLIKTIDVIKGEWNVRIRGDYTNMIRTQVLSSAEYLKMPILLSPNGRNVQRRGKTPRIYQQPLHIDFRDLRTRSRLGNKTIDDDE